jgi:predicted DNA binding protein
MTSIEWLRNKLYQHEHHINILDVATINGYFEQAKEMHKQEITDAFDSGVEDDGYIDNAEQYYQETFVSKGSDDHISDISKMVEVPQQEISEEAKKRAANYMSLKGALESKNTQYVDFSNPNANNIKSSSTQLLQQENLYTEEQVRKAYEYGNNYHKGSIADAQEYTFEKLIQSLKQPM